MSAPRTPDRLLLVLALVALLVLAVASAVLALMLASQALNS